MSTPTILITGSEGQLGKSLQKIAVTYTGFDFVFLSRSSMPLDNADEIKKAFELYKPQYCINCAAHTAVDKAESEPQQAMLINAEAVGLMAQLCKNYHSKFIHISTDYVFNGLSSIAYKEDDALDPINVYGTTKAKGEELTLLNNPDAIIIRTAWVYSEYGKNFVKTMIQLMEQRDTINVVSDQVGSPTYAHDLAEAIMKMVEEGCSKPGIFHFSNEGNISWYAFAVAIKACIESKCILNPIPSSSYPTPAKRPSFSLLDTSKIIREYNVIVPYWKDSLEVCIRNYRSAKN
ncbi:MAG: dTDP-4-dehydrorhamnose reductase [Agriterribacter sp.]